MPRAVLLDGGMGHQLKAMGVKIEGPRGSMQRFLGVAMANSKQPELVTAAHLSYIDAGADVITTNNYAVRPQTLNPRPRRESRGGGAKCLINPKPGGAELPGHVR